MPVNISNRDKATICKALMDIALNTPIRNDRHQALSVIEIIIANDTISNEVLETVKDIFHVCGKSYEFTLVSNLLNNKLFTEHIRFKNLNYSLAKENSKLQLIAASDIVLLELWEPNKLKVKKDKFDEILIL